MLKLGNEMFRIFSSLLVISFVLCALVRYVSGKDQPEYSDDDQSTNKKKYPNYANTGGFTGFPFIHPFVPSC